MGIWMNANFVTGAVARQNRNRIHANFLISRPETPFECRRKPANERVANFRGTDRLADVTPDLALRLRKVANELRKKVELYASSVAIVSAGGFGAARPQAVILPNRQFLQHLGIEHGWNETRELQVIKRFGRLAGGINGCHQVFDSPIYIAFHHMLLS